MYTAQRLTLLYNVQQCQSVQYPTTEHRTTEPLNIALGHEVNH